MIFNKLVKLSTYIFIENLKPLWGHQNLIQGSQFQQLTFLIIYASFDVNMGISGAIVFV